MLTCKLHNGLEVLAKRDGGLGLGLAKPIGYANRTQAQNKIIQLSLGDEWQVYHVGRPFYVVLSLVKQHTKETNMSKTYTLPTSAGDLVLFVEYDDGVPDGGGSIESKLEREVCPACNLSDCNFSCDGSKGAYEEENAESEVDVLGRHFYNGFLDAVESIALAHACAGIDVQSAAYLEGLNTAIDAAANNY